MVMNQEVYQPLGRLQEFGSIKFRSDTPESLLRRIRQIFIQMYSQEKLNMKLKISDSNRQKMRKQQISSQDPLINYTLNFIFVHIEQMNLEELRFYKQSFQSFDKNLLLTMGTVKMPNLEYLDLKNCQLGSIQALGFLDLTGVKKLFLNDNNLTNLKSFAKLYLPKLYWLELGFNEIKDTKGFNRILMAKRIALLQVTEKDKNINRDAFTYLSSWIFKLPFQHINYVRKNQKYLNFRISPIKKAQNKYSEISFR